MTTIGFIVNGSPHSAIGERAKAFAEHLRNRFDIHIAYRTSHKLRSVLSFLRFLIRIRPRLIYVFDMSYSGVLAATLYKLTRKTCVIIDTGDAIYELAQSMGRSRIGLWLTRLLEKLSLRIADRMVVRGTFHQRLLKEQGIQAEVIRDGVDTEQFKPLAVESLRQQFGLDRVLTVGVMGSVIWSDQRQTCYGYELVEVIRLLKDEAVKGILIGDGSGLPRLQSLCKEYGIEDRIIFLGRIPYDNLPAYLNLIDVCLSTQTNDVIGQVRTTGKLPLYLACGRFVLASEVGEASLVLEKVMLVPYEGTKDNQYSRRLAERLRAILNQPEMIYQGVENVSLAQKYFDYSTLAERLGNLIQTTIGPS
jgi:glycosyltransferase involved in cell wall biosynthesis